ncbi:MAG: TIGR02444 family protein, partial [Acetobacteraceae bacterium]|nr:TIGR02444 family protein [Acetobacteraceae bacterium]MBV8589699.1 TIGR02444 family protein [Acetobacteraceae bacterium]
LLWRAASGILITGAQIGSVDAAVKDWREQIVKPLRTVRGRLKTENFASNFDEAGCFRSNIKAAELEAERLEQQVLERWAAPPESPPRQVSPIQATQANIAAYAAVIGRQLPHDSVEVFLNEIQGL